MAEKEVSEEKNEIALLERLDIDDMTSEGRTMVEKWAKDLSKAPVPKQLAVGGALGWLAGYTTMKVGKMAATAIGGSLLLLQIAHHKGYVKVDWNKMTNDSSSLASQVKEKLHLRSKTGMEKFQDFASKNVYVAGGFTGGFFLGIASS
jgi:uncharacterized membrane protein (Fun14 family)